MDQNARLSIQVLMEGVAEAERQLDAMNNKIKDTEQATDKASKSGDGFFGGFLGGAAKLGLAVNGFTALGGAVTGAVSSLTAGNAEFERYETQFGVLLKATDEFAAKTKGVTDPLEKEALAAQMAKDRIKELAHFGAVTPFDLPEVVKADKVLQGFGLHSQEAAKKFGFSGEEIRTIAGDLAAGTGQKFEDIALTIGKFASGATGEAMMRFQELGIVTKEQLAKMGVEFNKSGGLVSPLPEALNKILVASKTKFGGMMDAQSKTLEGMMSNFQDWVGNATRTMAAPIFDKFKEGLGALLDFLSSPAVMNALTTVANLLADGIGFALNVVGGIINTVSPIISALFSTISEGGGPLTMFQSVMDGLSGPIQMVSNFVADIADNIRIFIESIQGGTDPVTAFFGLLTDNFNSLTTFLGNLVGWVGEQLPGLIAQLQEWGKAFIDWIAPMIPKWLQAAGNFIGTVLGWILGTALPKLLESLGTWARAFTDWLGPQLPVLWANLVDMLGKLWDWIVNVGAPTLIEKLQEWGKAFVDWVGPNIGPALGELGNFLGNLADWLITTALPTIIGKLAEWGWALVQWVAPMIPPLLGKLFELLGSVGNWILTVALPEIGKHLLKWGEAFLSWIGTSVLPFIGEKLGEVWEAIKSWIGSTATNILEAVKGIGSNVVAGIKQGITDAWNGFTGWIHDKIMLIPEAVRNFLGIHSPSAVFADIGENIMRGLSVGVTNKKDEPKDALIGALGEVVASISEFVNKRGDEDKSVIVKWRDGFNSIYDFMRNAWIPQIGVLFKTGFTQWLSAENDFLNDFLSSWNAAMASLLVPSLPPFPDGSGGGGGGGGGGSGSGSGSGGSGGGPGGGSGGPTGRGIDRPVGGMETSATRPVVQVYVEDGTGEYLPASAKRVRVMSQALSTRRAVRLGRAGSII